MPLTDAERQFLGSEWRWFVCETTAVRDNYPTARDEDRESPFRSEAGPAAVLPAMHEILDDDNQLHRVTVAGIVEVDFRDLTPNLTLYANRLGLEAGRTMIIASVTHDYQTRRTTFLLFG